jgi:hypothetical protein
LAGALRTSVPFRRILSGRYEERGKPSFARVLERLRDHPDAQTSLPADAPSSWLCTSREEVTIFLSRRMTPSSAGANTPATAYGSYFPGQYVGVASIQAVATLQHGANGDTAAGPFTFQLTNLAGQVVLAASGTFSATRLKIEPLATP